MFGYLDVQRDKLSDGARGFWHAFMCGECISTKNLFGNLPRLYVNHDITFFNVLFHSICGMEVQTEKLHCLSHPIKKQTIVKPDALTDKISAANVILMYWNLFDDVTDGTGLVKRMAFASLKKAYKKARSILPELDKSVDENYRNLRKSETDKNSGLDETAHHFAKLSQDFCKDVLGEKSTEFAETLCYNIGKWIYLIDALDDLKKDLRRKNYNPFAAAYKVKTEKQLAEHFDDVKFIMYSVLNRIAQCFNDLNLSLYECLPRNVLLLSIREKTQTILNKYKSPTEAK